MNLDEANGNSILRMSSLKSNSEAILIELLRKEGLQSLDGISLERYVSTLVRTTKLRFRQRRNITMSQLKLQVEVLAVLSAGIEITPASAELSVILLRLLRECLVQTNMFNILLSQPELEILFRANSISIEKRKSFSCA